MKRTLAVLLAAVISISLCSCSFTDKITGKIIGAVRFGLDSNYDSSFAASAGYSSNFSPSDELCDKVDFIKNPAGYTSVDPRNYYNYNQLTESQQYIYNVMYEATQGMAKEMFFVGKCDEFDVSAAFYALKNDYPQMFWFGSAYGVALKEDGNAYVRFYQDGDEGYGYVCSSVVERDAMQQKLSNAIDGIISRIITDGMSEYERELAIHDWLCENVTYYKEALDAPYSNEYANAWTAYGALVEGRAVCEGYTKAFQLLLNLVGIECTSCIGVADGDSHIWNIVKIDGNWYSTDVTWNDNKIGTLQYSHAYFNINDTRMNIEHSAYDTLSSSIKYEDVSAGAFNFSLPRCTSLNENFYKKNGTYIESESEYKDIITRAFSAAASKSIYTVEFIYGYNTAADAKYVSNDITKYDVNRTLSQYYDSSGRLEYSDIGGGAFYITVLK